ncbi:MAG: glycerate-2-kinase family protein, partial [Desulfovibrio sp.]|nr:glycerate-2-kinase family protein [Desulfovibrio sp.]
MTYFKNHNELLAHGNTALRADSLDILNAGLASADPGRKARELISLEGDVLRIAGRKFDLRKAGNIYVLGAGKASFPIAEALDDILGDRIADGVVICKEGQKGKLERSRLFLAGHPIPDEAGLAAAHCALKLARGTGPGDIVLACVTGGSSALMPLPVPEISLEDKKIVNILLLACGANIIEINAVRKHLSLVKGGLLAMALHPRTVLVNLTVSDVIGDPYDYITDPTVPDTSSFAD